MADKVLVCRQCRCQPDVIKETGKSDVIRCPQCGASGTFREVLDQAAKYESSLIMDDFSKRMEKSFRGMKNVSYKRGSRSRPALPAFVYR